MESRVSIPYEVMITIIHDMQQESIKDVCDETQNIFLELLLDYYDSTIEIGDSIKQEITSINDIPLLEDDLNSYGFLAVGLNWKNLEHAFVLINTKKNTYIIDSYVNLRCISYRKFDFDRLINLRSLDDWNNLFLANEEEMNNEDNEFILHYGYYPLPHIDK